MEVVQLRVSVLELRVAWMRTAWRMLEEKVQKWTKQTYVSLIYVFLNGTVARKPRGCGQMLNVYCSRWVVQVQA